MNARHQNFKTSWGRRFFAPDKQIIDGVFYKEVKEEHFFDKYSGWGLARETLKYLRDNGIQKIVLTCEDNKTKYTTTLDTFIKKGTRGSFGKAGTQYFLTVNDENYKVTRLK